MEQLTKNQAVATSQEAVQNQNEPQLRDERSEERRVGKECRDRWSAQEYKENAALQAVGGEDARAGRDRTRYGGAAYHEPAFACKQKTAYEDGLGIPAEPLFRSKVRYGPCC